MIKTDTLLLINDPKLKKIYEDEVIRQFTLNTKCYKTLALIVMMVEAFSIIIDYFWILHISVENTYYVPGFSSRIALTLLEGISLYIYIRQNCKGNKKHLNAIEFIFTILFTCSPVGYNHAVLTYIVDSNISKVTATAFGLKIGTELLWRYAFISVMAKLWISQALNILISLCWVFIWIVLQNQILLISEIILNIVIWLSILLISEKARRVSILKHRERVNTEFIYKKIFGTAPDSVLVYNDQGNLMYTSPLAKKTFGDNLQNLEKIRAFEWRGPSEISRFKRSQSLFLAGKRRNSVSGRKASVSHSPHIMATVNTIMDIVKLFKQSMIEDHYNALYECKYTEETRNQERKLELKASIIKRSQAEQFLLVRIMDITERDQILTLEKENTAYRNNLLASFSHELRTPLNGVIGFLEQAVDCSEFATSLKEKYIIPALLSAKLLVSLIQDILDYSQLLVDQFDLHIERRKLKETLWDCVNLFESKLREKRLNYSVNISNRIPNHVYTDHQRISQVLVNLLGNAVKFTMAGEITIIAEPVGKDAVKIIIDDTGIGMDEQAKKRLHNNLKLGMAKEKVTSSTAGVGLGLMISHKIAQKVSRNEKEGIKFESKANGKGCRFSFIIRNIFSPTAFVSNSEITLSDVSEFDEYNKITKNASHIQMDRLIFPSHTRSSIMSNISQTPMEKFRVLIVDDDVFNITALESLCHSLNLKTDRAFHGREALEKILSRNKQDTLDVKGSEPYKLVLMDCNMPIMDGFEATETIREKMDKQEIKCMKIIGVTAYVNEIDVKRCYTSGMDEVLHKPVFKKVLIETLKKHKIIS